LFFKIGWISGGGFFLDLGQDYGWDDGLTFYLKDEIVAECK
jgi:hypothetical protein